MCVNRNILVASLALLFIFCKASYANRGEAVGELMVRLGNSLTSGGSKADVLRAKSIRSEFLTKVKAEHFKDLRTLSRYDRRAFSGHILRYARKRITLAEHMRSGDEIPKSVAEALIKVFHSNELLDVNSIHQMWLVVIKVFPSKIDGFLYDFVEVIFEKFTKTPYDFEVYRAAASLVKGLIPPGKHPELAQSLAKISEDIMRLGHIVNGKEIAKGSLDVISPFSVVERSHSMRLGVKLGIKYNDEWVKNTSRMIDDVANTGNLSDLSAKFSNAFKRAREFGDQFVGDTNLAKKVIFGFKDTILKGRTVKDDKVTIYFRWILNDRKILNISNDEVAKIIAEIIESKNLFHLMG